MMKVVYSGVMGGQNGFTDAMRRVCDNFDDVRLSNVNNRLQSLKHGEIDLFFMQPQDAGITKETIEHLKKIDCYIIQWCGDKRHKLPECYFNYTKWGVDLTCFSNMEDIEIMRKCGYQSDWLQIGFDPNIYNTIGNVNSIAEIVFFGNTFGHFPLSGLRRDMVKELKRTYGERFKAFGSGQPDGGQFMNDQLGEAAVYRGAKIGINLSHFDSDRYSSDRLFRMIGTGIMVLSHRYQGIEKDFEIGTHLDVFNDLNDLKQKINHYLQHEEQRKQIAFLGHKLAEEKYSFYSMGEEILNLYNKYHN